MRKPDHDQFYRARAVSGYADEHNGRPISRVTLVIEDDENLDSNGWRLSWSGWQHTAGCEEVTLKSLALMGWIPGSEPFEFDGRHCRVKIEHRNGYVECAGVWEQKEGSVKPRESTLLPAQRKDFAAQMAAKMRALGLAGTAPAAPAQPPAPAWTPPPGGTPFTSPTPPQAGVAPLPVPTRKLGFCADCGSPNKPHPQKAGATVCSNEACDNSIPF